MTWVTGADLFRQCRPRVALASEPSNYRGFRFARRIGRAILKPVTYVLAALYFLVDAVFMAIAKPISDWLARHVAPRRLRAWIRSLRPTRRWRCFWYR